MVWLGPTDERELEIYRPVLLAREDERARLHDLLRMFRWQAGIVPLAGLAMLPVLDEGTLLAGPLALVFGVSLFDLALLLVHRRAADARIRAVWSEARRRIAEHRSMFGPTVMLPRCPSCGSARTRIVPQTVDGNVVFLRICDRCAVAWAR